MAYEEKKKKRQDIEGLEKTGATGTFRHCSQVFQFISHFRKLLKATKAKIMQKLEASNSISRCTANRNAYVGF